MALPVEPPSAHHGIEISPEVVEIASRPKFLSWNSWSGAFFSLTPDTTTSLLFSLIYQLLCLLEIHIYYHLALPRICSLTLVDVLSHSHRIVDSRLFSLHLQLQPFFFTFQPWQSYQIFPNNKDLWTSTLSLRQAFKKNDSTLERHRKA